MNRAAWAKGGKPRTPLRDCKPGARFTAPETGVVEGPESGGVAVLIERKWQGGKRKRYREVWSAFVRVEVV
jgi:hypothetical protein